jgi:hypothetical protein
LVDHFSTSKSTVSEHITNILQEKELDENSVVRNFRTTANDGKEYLITHYALPMILAIGFRVRSMRGTQFKQWANRHLSKYMVKACSTFLEVQTPQDSPQKLSGESGSLMS